MSFHITRLEKTIHQSGESDLYYLPTLADIHLKAWLSVPLYKLIHYGPPSSYPAIMDWSMARHKKSLLHDPTCQFLCLLRCEEPEVGEPWKVIAFVKYNVYDTEESLRERQDVGKRSWPEFTNVKLVEEFWGEIVRSRKMHSESMGPHVSVDILATDPEFQRRGAGRMLMEKVVEEADERGLPCVLEGSEEGLRLYRSVGFEEVVGEGGSIWVDLGRWVDGGDKGKGWRGDVEVKLEKGGGWYRQAVMERKAKGR